jgi:hypothetical protein
MFSASLPFRYDGKGPIFTEHLERCYDAQWVPAPAATYPNRARSPSRNVTEGQEGAEKSSGSSGGGAVAAPAAAPVAAYRPRGSTGALSEAMRRPVAQAGKVLPPKAPGSAAPGGASVGKYVAPQRKIPGMAAGPSAGAGAGGANKKKIIPAPASR